MVLNVDDWVETEAGEIGLVVDAAQWLSTVDGQRRVTLYTPEDQRPHVVKVDDIVGKFPTILRGGQVT